MIDIKAISPNELYKIEEYPDNVLKWFTKDQIESFIREKYKKIIHLYYIFPQEKAEGHL